MLSELLEGRQMLAADVPGDDISAAHSVTLEPDSLLEISQMIGDGDYGSNDVDLYRIWLNEGDFIDVDVDAEYLDDGTYNGYLDTHLRLFDFEGTEQASNASGSSPNDSYSSFDPYLSYTALASDYHYVGISGAGNEFYDPTFGGSGYGGYYTGNYILQLQLSPADGDGGGDNQPPTAADDSYSVVPGMTLSVPASGVLGNDVDADADPLTATLQLEPEYGTLNYFNADGSFEYVPGGGFIGVDTFSYAASDESESSTAIVTITVTDQSNEAPTAVNDIASTTVNVSVDIDVLSNDSDPEDDTITISATGFPANGGVEIINTVDGDQLRYTPNVDFVGVDTFSYTITDGQGNSDTATITLVVAGETGNSGTVNEIVVDSNADTIDFNDAYITLREAIEIANTNGARDVIRFSLPTEITAIDLTAAQSLVIGTDLTIEGPTDRDLTIRIADSNDARIRPLIVAAGEVEVRNLQISEGNLLGEDGGGIWNSAQLVLENVIVRANSAGRHGGGLYNAPTGDVTLLSSSLIGNTASADGGGVHSEGLLRGERSSIVNNSSRSGGGLSLAFGSDSTLENATVSQNTASASGGGLYVEGSLNATSSTIVENSAQPGIAGVVAEASSTVTLANTIVAKNALDDDVSGSFISAGHNLIGNAGSASGFAATGDQVGGPANVLDPLVGPLQNNGGVTLTHQLLVGSPAIDAGDDSAAPSVDQRGAPRILDGLDPADPSDDVATVDIGAFEFGAFFVNSDIDAIDSTSLGDGRVDAGTSGDDDTVSLRAAIQELNALAGLNNASGGVLEGVILFQPGFGGTLLHSGAAEDEAVTGDLDVYGKLTLLGNGLEATLIDGKHRSPYVAVLNSLEVPEQPYLPEYLDVIPWGYGGPILGDRIFHVHEDASLTLHDVTVAGGYAQPEGSSTSGEGGGILNDGGTVLTERSLLGYHQGANGGAIFNRGGEVLLDERTFLLLNHGDRGGAIYIDSGDVTIAGEGHVERNLSEYDGGAIYTLGSLAITEQSVLIQNVASEPNARGSAIYIKDGQTVIDGGSGLLWNSANMVPNRGAGIYNAAELVVSGESYFTGNYNGGGVGGAIMNTGRATVTDVTFSQNYAAFGGAAFYNLDHGVATLNHVTIDGNSVDNATSWGGAIINDNAELMIVNSTIQNTAGTLHGGAIFNFDIQAKVTIIDSFFHNNEAIYSGGSIYNDFGTVEIYGSVFDAGHDFNEAGNGIVNFSENIYLGETPEVPLRLDAGVTPWQDILYLADVSPLQRLELPVDVMLDNERITIVEIDDYLDAVTVQRTTRDWHDVAADFFVIINEHQSKVLIEPDSIFDSYQLPLDIVMNDEVMTVTEVDEGLMTVLRGRNGTRPQVHHGPSRIWGRGGALTIKGSTFFGQGGNVGNGSASGVTVVHTQVDPFVRETVIEGSTFHANRDSVDTGWSSSPMNTPVIQVGRNDGPWIWDQLDWRRNAMAPAGRGEVPSLLWHSQPAPPQTWFNEAGAEKEPTLFLQNNVISDPAGEYAHNIDGPLVAHQRGLGLSSEFDSLNANANGQFVINGFVKSGGGNFISRESVATTLTEAMVDPNDDVLVVKNPDQWFSPNWVGPENAFPPNSFLIRVRHKATEDELHTSGAVADHYGYVVEEMMVSHVTWNQEENDDSDEVTHAYYLHVARGLNGTPVLHHPVGSEITYSLAGFHAPNDRFGAPNLAWNPIDGQYGYELGIQITESGGIDATENVFEVSDPQLLPPSPFQIRVHHEVVISEDPEIVEYYEEDMYVYDVVDSRLLVQRGVNRTQAIPHPSGAFIQFPGPRTELDPKLSGPGNFGGPTRTVVPLPGSPLIGTGEAVGFESKSTLLSSGLSSQYSVSERLVLAVDADWVYLAADLSDTDVVISVDNPTRLPAVPFDAKIAEERVTVTAIDALAGTVSVVRGVQQSTATAHLSGIKLEFGSAIVAPATVTAAVASEDTQIRLDNVAQLPAVPFDAFIGGEHLVVTGIDLNEQKITVQRGAYGSEATQHEQDTPLRFGNASADTDDTVFYVEDTSWVEELPLVIRAHDELMTVVAVHHGERLVRVLRGQFGTTPVDHQAVTQISDNYGMDVPILFAAPDDTSPIKLKENVTAEENVWTVGSTAELAVGDLLWIGTEFVVVLEVISATEIHVDRNNIPSNIDPLNNQRYSLNSESRPHNAGQRIYRVTPISADPNQTEFSVGSTMGLPEVPFITRMDQERLRVVAVDHERATITVERGAFGTVVQAHRFLSEPDRGTFAIVDAQSTDFPMAVREDPLLSQVQLLTSLDDTTTEDIRVANVSALPVVPFLARIGSEYVEVIQTTIDESGQATLRIRRGMYGTAATCHPVGVAIEFGQYGYEARMGDELVQIDSVDPEWNLTTLVRGVHGTAVERHETGMGILFGNDGVSEGFHGLIGRLVNEVSPGAAEIHVTGLPLRTLTLPIDLRIHDEVMFATDADWLDDGSVLLSVDRGQYGTVASSHVGGIDVRVLEDQSGQQRYQQATDDVNRQIDVGASEATIFEVTTAADFIDDHLGDGVAANSTAQGISLRAAIMEGNAQLGTTTILLPPGTYTLSLDGLADDASESGDLDILRHVNLVGAGADVTTIDAGGLDRLFDVFAELRVSGVTLTGGDTSSDGGAIRVRSGGLVIADEVHLVNNQAQRGAGIYSEGSTEVTRSTFSFNQAQMQGGALFAASGDVFLENSTLSANSASSGGGLYVEQGVNASVLSSTITLNTAAVGAGIETASMLTLGNTIVAANSGSSSPEIDVAGFVTSIGNNLLGVRRPIPTTLSSAVDSTTQSIHLGDTSAMPPVPFVLQLGGTELVLVSTIAGNEATVIRGYGGTTSQSHVSGTDVRVDGFFSGGDLAGDTASPLDPQLTSLAVAPLGRVPVHQPATGSPVIDAGKNESFDGSSVHLVHDFDWLTHHLFVDEWQNLPDVPFPIDVDGEVMTVSEVDRNRLTVISRNSSYAANIIAGDVVIDGAAVRILTDSSGNARLFSSSGSQQDDGSDTSDDSDGYGGSDSGSNSDDGSSSDSGGDSYGGGNDAPTEPQPGSGPGTIDIGAFELTPLYNLTDAVPATDTDTDQPEGNLYTFTITRTGYLAATTSVAYTTVGTGIHPASADDFLGEEFPTGVLSFEPGETEKQITLEVPDDGMLEHDETFEVILFDPSWGTRLIGSAVLATIRDNNDTEITLTATPRTEGSSIVFQATSSNAVDGGFSVSISTSDGTAVSGEDYLPEDTTVTFAGLAGETVRIPVSTLGDAVVERDETVTLDILSIEDLPPEFLSRVTIVDSTATSTILNDDETTLRVLDFEVAEGDSATPGTEQWQTINVQVEVGNNAVDVGFTVTAETSELVGGATMGDDYQTASSVLSFTGQAGEIVSLPILIEADWVDEADEALEIALTNLDAFGREGGLALSGGLVTIMNDDAPRIVVESTRSTDRPGAGDNPNSELVTTDFTVSLFKPLGPVTVDVSTVSGTAIADDNSNPSAPVLNDFVPKTETLSFSGVHGEQATFSVDVRVDDTVELEETFQAVLSNLIAGGSESQYTLTDGTATIANQDSAQLIIADAVAFENEGLITFTVQLVGNVQGPFTAEVTVSGVGAAQGSDFSTTSGTLTFAGNDGESQEFTVELNNDGSIEPTETVEVFISSVLLGAGGATTPIAGVTAGGSAQGTINEYLPVDDDDWEEAEGVAHDCYSWLPYGGPWDGTYPTPAIWSSFESAINEISERHLALMATDPNGIWSDGFWLANPALLATNEANKALVHILASGQEDVDFIVSGNWTAISLRSSLIPDDIDTWVPDWDHCKPVDDDDEEEDDSGGDVKVDVENLLANRPTIETDWQISHNESITFAPFANLDYRRPESPDQLTLAATTPEGTEILAIGGEAVDLSFGRLELHPDLSLTFTPYSEANGSPQSLWLSNRTELEGDHTRLLPEVDANGYEVRHSQIEVFDLHIMDTPASGSSSDLVISGPDAAIPYLSRTIELPISNQLPVLPDSLLPDYEGTAGYYIEVTGVNPVTGLEEQQERYLPAGVFPLDSPLFAHHSSTYEFDVNDLLHDPDGDDIKIVGLAIENTNDSGYFTDSADVLLGNIQSYNNTAPLNTIPRHLEFRVQDETKIKITNQLDADEAQLDHVPAPGGGFGQRWEENSQSKLIELLVFVTDGQKDDFRTDPETEFLPSGGDDVLQALRVTVRPNVYFSEGTFETFTSAPQVDPRPWLQHSVNDHNTYAGDGDTSAWTLNTIPLVHGSERTIEAVGGVGVDLFNNSFQVTHDLLLDRSGGASELSLPGLIYDSSTVHVEALELAAEGLDPNDFYSTRIKTILEHASVPDQVDITLDWRGPARSTQTSYSLRFNENGEVIDENDVVLPEFPAWEDGRYVIDVMPQEIDERSGVYQWEMKVEITADQDNPDGETLTLRKYGEVPVIVGDHSNPLGQGWFLEGVPSLFLDTRDDGDKISDRFLLSFPGSSAMMFDASPVTLTDMAYTGPLNNVQFGSLTIGSDGFDDKRVFGTLRYQEDPDGDEVTYDDGTGLHYVFKRHEHPSTSESIFLIDRMEPPGVDFVHADDASSRRGVSFVWNVAPGGGADDHPILQTIKASDGSETTFEYDADHYIDFLTTGTRKVDFEVDSHRQLREIVYKADASIAGSTDRKRKFLYHEVSDNPTGGSEIGPMRAAQWVDGSGDVVRQIQMVTDTQTQKMDWVVVGGQEIADGEEPADVAAADVGRVVYQVSTGKVSELTNRENEKGILLSEITVQAKDLQKYQDSAAAPIHDAEYVSAYNLNRSGQLVRHEELFQETVLSRFDTAYNSAGFLKRTSDAHPSLSDELAAARVTRYSYDYQSPTFYTDTDPNGNDDEKPRYDPDDYRGNVTFIHDARGLRRLEYETDDENGAALGTLVRSVAPWKVTQGRAIPRETYYYRSSTDGQTQAVWTVRGMRDAELENPAYPDPKPPMPDRENTSVQAEDYYGFQTYENGRLKTHTDTRGLETTYDYDGFGRVEFMTVVDEGIDEHDAADDLTTTTKFVYDDFGFVHQEILYAGAAGGDVISRTTSTHDHFGNLISTQTEASVMDEHGAVATQTVVSSSFTFTVDGLNESVTDASGTKTTFVYNLAGQLTETTEAVGETYLAAYSGEQESIEQKTTYTYYTDGSLQSVDHPGASATNYYRDPNEFKEWGETTGVAKEYDFTTESRTFGSQVLQTEFDELGRVVEEKDLLTGAQTNYAYNDIRHDLPTTITTKINTGKDDDHNVIFQDSVLVQKYEADGSVAYLQSESLPGIEYVRDELGNLQSQTVLAQLGGKYEFVTNSAGDVIESIETRKSTTGDRGKKFLTYVAYDESGRARVMKDPLTNEGQQTTIGTNDDAVDEPDGSGPATTTFSFENGLLKTVSEDRTGATSTQWINGVGQVVQTENSLGGKQRFEYDQNGNLTHERFVPAAGDGAPARHTEYVYDELNQRRATHAHSSTGTLSTKSDPVLTGTGLAIHTTNPAGTVTTSHIDVLGNQYQVDYPSSGGVPRLGSDDLTEDHGAFSVITSYLYKPAEQEIVRAVRSPVKPFVTRTATSVLSSDGRLLRTYPGSPGELNIEPLGTPELTRSYNSAGQVEASWDSNGNVTHYGYDYDVTGTGGVSSIITPVPDDDLQTRRAYFKYDSAGNRIAESDEENFEGKKQIRWNYDALGRVTLEWTRVDNGAVGHLFIDQGDEYREWNYLGNQVTFENRNNETTVTTFDPAARILTEVADGVTITTTFNSDGQIAKMEDSRGIGAIRYLYDDYGRRIQETQGEVGVSQSPLVRLNHGFDAKGNRTDIDVHVDRGNTAEESDDKWILNSHRSFDRFGRVVAQQHDLKSAPLAEMTDLWSNGSIGPDRLIHYRYNADSSLQTVSRYDAITADPTQFRGLSTLLYHADGKPYNITHTQDKDQTDPISIFRLLQDGIHIERQFEVYDSNGDRIANTANFLENETIEFDEARALQSDAAGIRTYDASGNRTDNRLIESPNRLVSDPGFSYEYDYEGRLRARENHIFSIEVDSQDAGSGFSRPLLGPISAEEGAFGGGDGNQLVTTQTDGNEIFIAELSLTTPQDYDVWIIWKKIESNGGTASVKVESNDNGHLLPVGNVVYETDIDYSKDPEGLVHETGYGWQHLSTVTVDAPGIIRVRVIQNGDGNVAFDAVKVTPRLARTFYSWDSRNRLEKVSLIDAAGTRETIEYEYDPLDRLIARREKRYSYTTGQFVSDVRTGFAYLGGKVLFEFDEDKKVNRAWLHSAANGDVLAVDEATGGTTDVVWMFGDFSGTMRTAAQVSGGAWQVLHHGFTSDGYPADGPTQMLGDTDNSLLINAPVIWNGYRFDDQSQLYVMHRGAYDPISGRSLSDRGGRNGYVVFSESTRLPPVNLSFGFTGSPEPELGIIASAFLKANNTVADVTGFNPLLDTSEEFQTGTVVVSSIGVGVAAGYFGLVAGVAELGAWLVGTGAAAGATDGAIHTYLGNPDAGFSDYVVGAGTGGVFGAMNPYHAYGSLGGGLVGSGVGALSGDAGRGYQVGSLVGGIATGGVLDARRSGSLIHARNYALMEGTVTAGAAATAWGLGGNADQILMAANFGSMAGGMAAARYVKCFVAGTPVAVGFESDVVVAGPTVIDTTSSNRQQHRWSSVYVAAGLLSLAAAQHLAQRKRGKRPQAIDLVHASTDFSFSVEPKTPAFDVDQVNFDELCEEFLMGSPPG